MICEAYVSFEVAKLLKEKGFDEKCLCNYDTDGNFFNLFYSTIYCTELIDFNNVTQQELNKYGISTWANHISAPTRQMALAYLREEKRIVISIRCTYNDQLKPGSQDIYYVADIANLQKGKWEDNEIMANTYEEAVEAALKYVLMELL